MHLANPYYEVLSSVVRPSEYLLQPLGSRRQYARDFRSWQRQVRTGPAVHHDGAEKLTVILLSYKRIRNMEPLVASLLHTDFVEKIVLSNNNPDYRIRDWVRIEDTRLHLIDQPRRTPPGIRFELAAREPGPYYLTIDDDVLLAPGQVLQIFRHLIANRSVPHGFQGEVYLPDEPVFAKLGGWAVNLRGEKPVDTINCLYAFHRGHLTEMQRLARLVGLETGAVANGEDILLSASGTGRPWTHDLGKVLLCLSSHRKGVAIWRTQKDFFAERTALFLKLRALKGLP